MKIKNIDDLAPYDNAYSNNSLWNDNTNTYFLDSLLNNECSTCNKNQGQNTGMSDYITQLEYSYQNIPTANSPIHPVPISPTQFIPNNIGPIYHIPETLSYIPNNLEPIHSIPVSPTHSVPISPTHSVPVTPHSIPSNNGPIFPMPVMPSHSPKSPKRKRLSILLPNNNCPGSTYKTTNMMDYEKCKDECLSNNNCKSWTYDINNNICELKDQRMKCIHAPNKISGYITNAKQNSYSPDENKYTSNILVQWIN